MKLICNQWELYQDQSFYDMWAVRNSGDKSYNSPTLFHFIKKEDAEMFLGLINKCHCALGEENQNDKI